jgi:hypothetical protein
LLNLSVTSSEPEVKNKTFLLHFNLIMLHTWVFAT